MTIEPITLHHYTTPRATEMIMEHGLRPSNRQPGTGDLVTYAFLDKAQFAWPQPSDDPTGLHVLRKIVWPIDRNEKEGPYGIVRIEFEAPEQTRVYDRMQLDTSPEAYALSGVSLDTYLESQTYRQAEAVVREAIRPEQLHVAERLDRNAIKALFADYCQT